MVLLGEDLVEGNQSLQIKPRPKIGGAPYTVVAGGNQKLKVHLGEWARKNLSKCQKKAN